MRGPHRSLAGRLLAAESLIILAGAGTLTIVALGVAPAVFRTHVGMASGELTQAVERHLDEAFTQAMLLSLGVAVLAAVVTALAVGVFVTRRIVQPVSNLAAAAAAISGGDYRVRARVPRMGEEFAALETAFNDMAQTIENIEATRAAMLRDLAHELRTPLATVHGYVEGLADGVVAADGATWALLADQSARLQRLVEDIDRVSRAEERHLDLRLAPAAPRDLLRVAAAGAGAAYDAKGVSLRVDAAGALPGVRVDPDRMQEVLTNLLANALRHTPPGGSVQLTARARSGRWVELAVRDSGEGIAPEHLTRVFERFYRVDPSRRRHDGGSGIGLTIARALVRAHGGELRAQSAGPGAGATFVITLPAVTAPRAAAT